MNSEKNGSMEIKADWNDCLSKSAVCQRHILHIKLETLLGLIMYTHMNKQRL